MLSNLTQKQIAWAREYAACGNGRLAARKAGYSPGSVKSAAERNKKNKEIMEAVENFKKESPVATSDEVYELLTRILRSEDCKAADRTKAAEMISKRELQTDKNITVYFAVPRPKEEL